MQPLVDKIIIPILVQLLRIMVRIRLAAQHRHPQLAVGKADAVLFVVQHRQADSLTGNIRPALHRLLMAGEALFAEAKRDLARCPCVCSIDREAKLQRSARLLPVHLGAHRDLIVTGIKAVSLRQRRFAEV